MQHKIQFIVHKLLAVQEAVVSMYKTHNEVLQKLLQANTEKYLDSMSIVLPKQHYYYYKKSNPNGIT